MTRRPSSVCTNAPSVPAVRARAHTGCVEHVDHLLELSLTARIGTLLVGSVRQLPVCIGDTSALLLGPLTVEPPFRGRGIGRALLDRGLGEARAKGHRLVILVGDEAYYSRVGFRDDSERAGRHARPGRSGASIGLRTGARRVRGRIRHDPARLEPGAGGRGGKLRPAPFAVGDLAFVTSVMPVLATRIHDFND